MSRIRSYAARMVHTIPDDKGTCAEAKANSMKKLPPNVFDLQELREKSRVFSDRSHAGEVLSAMLPPYRAAGGLLLGIPAGGLPVASVISEKLALEMDAAVAEEELLEILS